MASRLTTLIVAIIVGGTLIAGLIVGAQRDDLTGPVDLIITNGRVYTGSDDSFDEALAVRGNKILRVGSNREIKRLRRPQTVVVDAHGATVLPGFDDAHLHLVKGGLTLTRLDLSGADTLTAIEGLVRAFAESHAERAWILGRGWTPAAFGGSMPSRQQLDALVPDRPACLTASDGRTAWVNSKALALAGVTRHTKNPADGTIVRDARGEPAGTLKEGAQALVERVIPAPSRDERMVAVRAAVEEAHRFGITSVVDAASTAEDIELYDELRTSGDLELRVYAALAVSESLTAADRVRFDSIRARYGDDPLFKAGAVKLVADGAVESRTAALIEPYADAAAAGTPAYTPEALDRVVSDFDRDGWQILVHAAGDAAVRMSLDSYERAAARNPAVGRGRRHRIEHARLVAADDLSRFAAAGVIASEQPYQASPTPAALALWTSRLGAERAARTWPFRSLEDAGARIAFGSDWPDAGIDPLYGVHMAVTRTAPDGTPEEGWTPAESLSLAAALDAYTSGAAYASFDELRKGRLARDMLADIVILSTDIFTPGTRLLDAVVETTIFDGRIVYTRTPPAETD